MEVNGAQKKNTVNQMVLNPIDFRSIWTKKYYGSQWNLNMFPNILQTIFFCVTQKKEIHNLEWGWANVLHGLSF